MIAQSVRHEISPFDPAFIGPKRPRAFVDPERLAELRVKYLQGTCHEAFAANIRSVPTYFQTHPSWLDCWNGYGESLTRLAADEAGQRAARSRQQINQAMI